MPDDRFQPDAALRGITSTEDRGKRGDRLVIDDPRAAEDAVKSAIDDALGEGVTGGVSASTKAALMTTGAALFEDRGPIGHVGRNSIPKSHRAEGRNFVD